MDPSIFARIVLLSAILSFPTQPSSSATPTLNNVTVYTVRAGDTLVSIALKFDTTVEAIRQVNGLKNADQIAVGQQLKIPLPVKPTAPPTAGAIGTPGPGSTSATTSTPGASSTYTVRPGDTLAAIAIRFGLTLDELAAANGITDVNSVKVGQVLTIPKRAPTVTPTRLPAGLELIPAAPRQGQTVEIKVTAANVTTATGSFLGENLHFIPQGNGLFALVGVSRCSKTGVFPLAVHLDGNGEAVPADPIQVQVVPTQFSVINIDLTPQMASALSDPVTERQENEKIARVVGQFTPTQYWRGHLTSPLPGTDLPAVTSAQFGQRRSYNNGPVGACGHEGQDFAVSAGTPAVAPGRGRVILAELQKVRGNVVFIDLGYGVYSGFYHLSKLLVQPGQMVDAGEKVGLVGTTGFSTGDHLHWSLWVEGEYVDPIEWLERVIP